MTRTRLDRALVERGLARSRTQAADLIRTGRVSVGGSSDVKASDPVSETDVIDARTDPYVSRAAHKLLGALADLRDEPGLTPPGRVLDAGASTGGFTQVLLERGATHVYAVDVGTGQLAPTLRDDPRVTPHEQTNLRDLAPAHVDDQPVDLVVADVSFISLTLLLAPLDAVTAPDGAWLLMVKPQFEVGRAALLDDAGPAGVVVDPGLQRRAVETVVEAAARLGWHLHAVVPSRLPGPAGNQEFFVHLRRSPRADPPDWPSSLCWAR